MWYKRHECGLRMAIFFSAATAAGAFGGLLAYGLMQMDGLAGTDGWAWIFIIEGILTTIVGTSPPPFPLPISPANPTSLCRLLRHERLP